MPSPIRWLAPLLLFGCGKMAVEGEVVDAKGAPLAGARVAIVGSPCMAVVDDKGRFDLPCLPGDYTLVLSSPGYTSEEIEVQAPERERYDIGKKVLIKIPETKGLFRFAEDEYQTMTAGQLTRNLETEGKLTHRSFCLDQPQSEVNSFSPGNHAFFDYEHAGWRVFRLDADGCAYRDTKNEKHQWKVEYREKAQFESRQLNEGKTVIVMALEKGDYFVADWKGFFVPVNSKDKTQAYSGFWLHVE